MVWTHKKRCKVHPTPEEEDENTALEAEVAHYRQWLQSLRELKSSPFVYDAHSIEDTDRLIQTLWTGSYKDALTSLPLANPEVTSVLLSLTESTYVPRTASQMNAHARHRENQFEGLFTVLSRMRSINNIPLLTVLLSLRAYRVKASSRFKDALACFFRGVLLSDDWVERLVARALELDPGPSYEVLQGIGACIFDNLTIRVAYKSYSTQDSTGYRLDMTNWVKMPLPHQLLPNSIDAETIWSQGLFKHSLSKTSFLQKFMPRTLAQSKDKRFKIYLEAARDGTLFDRPSYSSPWTAHIQTMPAIFDRLQGKYDDVEFELRHFRASFQNAVILFVGGDGLSIDRLQHLMATKSHIYMHTKPATIPVLGLSPHGEYHVCHAGYRNFRPLIEVFAVHLNNKQLVHDPQVSEYNPLRYALCIIMQACSEYLFELSQTPGAEDYEVTAAFMRACEQNIDLAWVAHILYDFLYLWWDFKRAVRCNDSAHLDTLWAEFLPLGRTTTANKTHYGVMAAMQVYFGCALHPALSTLYHRIRTLHTGGGEGTNTGWDMIPERVNDGLKRDVTCHISEDLIQRRLQDHRFLEVVDRGLDEVVHVMRQGPKAKMKKMESDVSSLKGLLRDKVGATWQRATKKNSISQLKIDAKHGLPWQNIARSYMQGAQGAQETVQQYVMRHLEQLAPWQSWSA